MRSDLPGAVRAAVEAADRPALVFDRERIEHNMRAIASAARDYTVLFAAKSFPHPMVRELAAKYFAGFDVASAGERDLVGAARVISIVDPAGRTTTANAKRVIVGCETVEQVVAADPRAEIAIRISMSITGRDPAVGAVQEGDHRRSRFGLESRDEIAALHAAAGARGVGVHVHHGPVAATSSERFIATAMAVLDHARDAGVEPRFIDLGGAWHAIPDLANTLAAIRAAVPSSIELVIEPGRVIVDGAGFACGRVTVARELGGRPLRVVDLSRICHLRWSQIELVTAHPGLGRATLVLGPTCFEEDVLGEWTAELAVGDRVIVRNVTGYAVAWNTGFAGVPPADVVIS